MTHDPVDHRAADDVRFAVAVARIRTEVFALGEAGIISINEAGDILAILDSADDRRAAAAKRAWAEENGVELIAPESAEVVEEV